MSKFGTELYVARIGDRDYLIDAALVPALNHVPAKFLPALLTALDRDFRARHAAWIKGDTRTVGRHAKAVDRAMPLLMKGKTYADVARTITGRDPELGSPERIARILANHFRGTDFRKKKAVRRQQRT